MNAHVFPRPLPALQGLPAHEWRKAAEDRIEALLEDASHLIEALDALDPDADLEPTLGAPDRGDFYVSQANWADGALGDHEREDVSEDEGAACDDEGALDARGL